MKQILRILFFGILPAWLSATELSPWFGPEFDIELRSTFQYQLYKHLRSPDGFIRHHSNDTFYTLSAALSAFGYSGELETTVAHTNKQRPAFDNFRLTGRYQILDDVPGIDPVSLVAGLTVTKAFWHSLHDVSSFHHGEIEAEAHLSIGKEFSFKQFWKNHLWAVAGIGIGDHGSPWFRANVYWDKNWWDRHFLRIFAHTLWGLGGNNLRRDKRFPGYGPIQHRSIDLGVRYSYEFECLGKLSLEYAQRLYAYNFPFQDHLFLISFRYRLPFASLGMPLKIQLGTL